jgi:hypothetical protein
MLSTRHHFFVTFSSCLPFITTGSVRLECYMVKKQTKNTPSPSCGPCSEPNPLVARYEENTKEIRSILRPFFLRLFWVRQSFGQRYKKIQSCYVFRKSGGASVSLRIFLLHTYVFTKVHRTHLRTK